MQGKKRSGECVIILTNTHSLRIIEMVMAKLKHIVAGLAKQSARKISEVSKAADELSNLLEAYQRYQEIDARMTSESESAKIGLALVLSLPQTPNMVGDAFDLKNRQECERIAHESEALPLTPQDLDLSKYPLWKIIREILRQVQEMRVYELEAHLKNFGIRTIRSAIESALATHNKQFKITKRGREKYVALKGA